MTDAHAVARDQLRSFIERIERLEEEKKSIADDIKDVKAEAKGCGFDIGTINAIIKLRKVDANERAERDALLDTYMIALGMLPEPAGEDYDREPGEPLDDRRSDNGLNIQTKHEDIRTAPETAEEQVPSSEQSEGNGSRDHQHVHSRQTDEAKHGGQDGEPAGADHATHSESDAGAIDATAPTSDERVSPAGSAAANAGGDHVDGGAERANRDENGEGAASALPAGSIVIESVPPAPMKRPDFATCFPELSNAAYAYLHDEIQANGICAPIVRHGEVILDGWDRYNISRELGFNYPVQPYTGSDALLDVIEWQRASRNFTPAQEKKIATDLAKEIPHRADDIFAAFGLAEVLEAAQ